MLWKIKLATNGLCEKDVNTLFFAAEELKKYLLQSVSDEIIICEGGDLTEGAIRLGVGLRDDIPPVEDAYYDDAIVIDVKGHSGVITGSNARSVLIAAYRYLRELGYTFIRPGKEGERAPEDFRAKDVFVCEAADYRYRNVCIEGSVFYESVADMIDWIPKVGMNGYYTQFFTPWIFFKRWYHHEGYEFKNPYLAPEPLTVEDVEGFVKTYEKEITKRSLVYVKVGHGWTCDPFGMTSLGWESVPKESIPKSVNKYFAQLNGERKLFDIPPMYVNVPLISQLCYGNPEVRETIISAFVDFCRENPHVDMVGFALADGDNNYCECDACKKLRPSDYKVMMVKEINKRLDQEGLHTKILFDVYVDHLWTPLEQTLPDDQSRLTMSFCPISRTYTSSFPLTTSKKIKKFEYNKLAFPESVEELLAYFGEWKKLFHNELVCFDYYYMWDCYKDIGRTEVARVIHDDIVNYRELDIGGLISCQAQRVFAPTSLGMNMMAATLWNRSCTFDEVRDYVLKAEFGKDFALVKDFLQDLSIYGLPEVVRMEKPLRAKENVASYEKCLSRLRGFVQTINEHIDAETDTCVNLSWKYLKFHTDVTTMLIELLKAMAQGEDYAPFWATLEDFVNRHEYDFKQYFDVFEFKRTYGRLFPMLAKDQKEITII